MVVVTVALCVISVVDTMITPHDDHNNMLTSSQHQQLSSTSTSQHVLRGGKLRRDHPLIIKLVQCRQAVIKSTYTVPTHNNLITTA